MPFKMKRPVIKGSKQHKASMAKSIVAQTRTQADPSLVEAGKRLGESIVPHEIDYSLRGLSSLDYGGDDDNDDDKRDRMPTEKIPRKKAKKLKVKKGKGPDLKKRKIPKKKKKSSVSIDLDYYKKSATIQKSKKRKVPAWLSKLFKSKNT